MTQCILASVIQQQLTMTQQQQQHRPEVCHYVTHTHTPTRKCAVTSAARPRRNSVPALRPRTSRTVNANNVASTPQFSWPAHVTLTFLSENGVSVRPTGAREYISTKVEFSQSFRSRLTDANDTDGWTDEQHNSVMNTFIRQTAAERQTEQNIYIEVKYTKIHDTINTIVICLTYGLEGHILSLS